MAEEKTTTDNKEQISNNTKPEPAVQKSEKPADEIKKEDKNIDKPKNDNNDYTFGYINSIGGRQIRVIVALMKEMGTNNAASTASLTQAPMLIRCSSVIFLICS